MQITASVQLFLTLLAGLILKLRAHSAEEAMEDGESFAYGIILLILNCSVVVALIMSIFLSFPCGRRCLEKKLTQSSTTVDADKKPSSVSVVPVSADADKMQEKHIDDLHSNLHNKMTVGHDNLKKVSNRKKKRMSQRINQRLAERAGQKFSRNGLHFGPHRF